MNYKVFKFLVLFSNASLLYHEREQIICEDKRIICRINTFHFLFGNCQKKIFLNAPILLFKICNKVHNSSLVKYIHFIQ